jgi:hypothetical protein
MQVFIAVVPEYEARRFASYLQFMFSMAEWKVELLALPGQHIFDGIEIGYLFDMNLNEPLPENKSEPAGEALLEELKKQEIEARIKRLPAHSHAAKRLRPSEVPPEAIVIKIGVKPSLDNMRYEKAAIERFEKGREESYNNLRQRFPGGKFPRGEDK